jgi:hypothetical protein
MEVMVVVYHGRRVRLSGRVGTGGVDCDDVFSDITDVSSGRVEDLFDRVNVSSGRVDVCSGKVDPAMAELVDDSSGKIEVVMREVDGV